MVQLPRLANMALLVQPTRDRLMNTFNSSARKLRIVLSTVVLALAGTVVLTAEAAPGGHEGGMGMGMGRPEHMARVLTSVGASAEQQAQIKQIMQTARADLQPQHAQGQALRQQMAALFALPTVDARAVETLRVQIQALHEQGSKRMTQALLDASRVLTLEQRQALAAKMNQMRGMMERHRAERDTLAKPN
jgi:periplasmic protein CpxP/Spy